MCWHCFGPDGLSPTFFGSTACQHPLRYSSSPNNLVTVTLPIRLACRCRLGLGLDSLELRPPTPSLSVLSTSSPPLGWFPLPQCLPKHDVVYLDDLPCTR